MSYEQILAKQVKIVDAGGHYLLDNVEDALQQVYDAPPPPQPIFMRIRTSALTLSNGECVVITGYLDMSNYDLTLNGDADLEIL